MLIDNSLLVCAGSDIGVSNEQGNLIGFVEIVPQHIGEGVNVTFHCDPLRLALESGDHGIAVADIGVQEVTQAGLAGILPEITGATIAFGIGSLQNGHLVAAVTGLDAGNTRGPVGAIVLKHTSPQGSFPAFATAQELPNGIGLVAIGDDQASAHLPNGMVDDQMASAPRLTIPA